MKRKAAAKASRTGPKIITIGEIVVEIMAETVGDGFREPLSLRGPFPSGAPAIFIDQVARLGRPAAMISCVGNDDFGRLNLDRLARDGVDISAIRIHPEQVTGSAFVRYRSNGDRDFVFSIKHSAYGHTKLDAAVEALLGTCGHLHIMGSSLFSPGIIAAAQAAVTQIKAKGGTVSFDPNVRKEMLGLPAMRDALHAMLAHADIFLPSGAELLMFTNATDEDEAIADLLGRGVGCIVVKRGAEGAGYHDCNGHRHVPAFEVAEVDPTGAGDCFGATFVTCRLQGRDVSESLRYASASGALAVGVRGPMEGANSFAELDAFMAEQRITARHSA